MFGLFVVNSTNNYENFSGRVHYEDVVLSLIQLPYQ